jgi:hypothetical protein
MAIAPSPVLVAIREDQLEAASALGPPLDDQAMAGQFAGYPDH